MNLKRFAELATTYRGRAIALRHDFHTHPELSWEEVRTTEKIASLLKEYGFENIRTGFKGTASGVVADLNTGKPGPCVALRADMDALPVAEENDLPYRSVEEGIMHACGHDAHMAMLLTSAMILAEVKEELPGRVRVIFQPAEEYGIESGADYMIREGVLEGVDAIAGLHIWSPLETGKIFYRYGPTMASCDRWTVKIKGLGGHGAMPHTAIDPTIAAATFASTLQTIVSREVDPQDIAVVSIGSLNSGAAFNVIPERAEITGNFRAFRPATRKDLEQMTRRIADGVCAALRCTADVEVTPFVSPVINEDKTTTLLKETAEELIGSENVQEAPPIMVSEDFSFYQEQIPGTFFFLGCGNREKGTDVSHHHPRFNIDDDALEIGIQTMTAFVWNYLSTNR